MTPKNHNYKREKSRNISQVILFWLLIISLSSCALLTLYIVQVQYRNFKQEAEFYRQRYLEEQKSVLKQKVEEAVNYVNYISKKTDDRLKNDIQSRVYEAWNVSNHLYDKYNAQLSDAEIGKLIKEALRPIRFNHGRGYYFIVSLDGVEELYPTNPELEGKNLIDLKDIEGKYVIKDEIETVKEHGEGFVTGYWPNPMVENDSGSMEYSFVKLFKPLNWLIGTGEFLHNVEQDMKVDTLEWLSKIRFAENSYIFADSYDGNALLMDGKIVHEPVNIWNLEDSHGIKVIQEETRIAQTNQEGGFLSYSWRKENGEFPEPVISFVKAVPKWDWVVGSSVYVNDIEKSISRQEDVLKQRVLSDIKKILLVFGASLPIVIFVSLVIARRFNNELNVFYSFLKRSNENQTEIELSGLKIREFLELGKATNRMIKRRKEAEDKLEQLSRTDPLTGLSNRRDMVEKINLEIKRSIRSGRAFSFLLIDIDHFKQVNDTFGHDAGDEVLKQISELLSSAARQSDVISRWGGEEFLVLLPDSDVHGAMATAEKLRHLVQQAVFLFEEKKIKVTLTLGVSVWREELTYEQLISISDSALYRGKRLGRNRVEVMESL